MSGLVAPSSVRAIGVFGISGVGKSTLISEFVKAHTGYLHVEASALIKSRLARCNVSSEALRTMPTERIIANQRLLVDAFEAVRSEHSDQTALLDAHSVIEGDDELVLVPTDVVRDLRLDRVLVVVDEPEAIVRRRRLDRARKRPTLTVEQTTLVQDRSVRQCRRYAAELNLPFGLVRGHDSSRFADAVAMR